MLKSVHSDDKSGSSKLDIFSEIHADISKSDRKSEALKFSRGCLLSENSAVVDATCPSVMRCASVTSAAAALLKNVSSKNSPRLRKPVEARADSSATFVCPSSTFAIVAAP